MARVGTSLSTMVKTAVVTVPSVAPPVGLDSVKLTVSSDSERLSLTIGI